MTRLTPPAKCSCWSQSSSRNQKGQRKLVKLLASEKQRKKDESFSASKGGTIYRTERLEVGSWWSPQTGWQFIKIKW